MIAHASPKDALLSLLMNRVMIKTDRKKNGSPRTRKIIYNKDICTQ